MNEMRERLMQLLGEAIEPYLDRIYPWDTFDDVADHLLDNGVIVPLVTVGQTVYRVGDPIKKIYEWDVVCIEVYGYETEYVDDSDNRFTADDIGKTVFLTREAVEAALKARENECTEE